MKVNMNKTKVTISGESRNGVQNTGRWPCDVCGRGVGINSMQCTNCQKLCDRKCSGIKVNMVKVSKCFACRDCADQPANMDRTDMDIVDGGSLDLEVMSVNGDTDAAVEVTVHTTTTTTSV